LPHTWNQWDATDNLPGYRRDASWYQKELFIPEVENNLTFILYFEDANISSEIYVNEQRAGGHVGGYIGFEVDITDYLNHGESNTISIRVDNSYNVDIIPSQMSDFFIYGGLTRDVWLMVVPQIHIKQIHIETPKVSEKEAIAHLEVTLSDPVKNDQNLILEAKILDAAGKAVLVKQEDVSAQLVCHKTDPPTGVIEIQFPSLKNPNLWSPDSPYLYTAQVSLKEQDRTLDQILDKFGYRWFEFREHGPFYLNGKRLLLRGTHRHEEHAGYGAAMPNELHRRDMEMIKELGANFVRLAHYPQDPEIYRACNELGLLVWDELPWCRGGLGNGSWKRHTKRLLKEMIDQNFNHPSIIIWSMGNEVYWLPERSEGDNIDSLRLFLKELNDFAHQLDSGRMTAIRKFYEGADIVDIFSPSIWAGWYSGVYTNYEKAITEARDKYKRLFHAEYGGSSHVGRHVENPISGEGIINTEGWEEAVNQVKVKNIARHGDWSESYIVDLFDWHLHISENLDWFTGNAQWAFKDFGTPLRPENPIPFVNQKGLVDRSGKPKDAYYVFKSYWTRDPKFCYIESQSWTDRIGPIGKSREICVFSNSDEVELYLNGMDLGKRKRNKSQFPAQGLTWDVLFEEGPNILVANGYVGDNRVCADTLSILYSFKKSGKPEQFDLTSYPLTNGNLLITATLVDKNGQQCLDYNERIYFSCDGDGYLLHNYGTPTRSPVIEMANGQASIECKYFPGKRVIIEARNQDFKGNYLVIE
jgi:beta-galactosidase